MRHTSTVQREDHKLKEDLELKQKEERKGDFKIFLSKRPSPV